MPADMQKIFCAPEKDDCSAKNFIRDVAPALGGAANLKLAYTGICFKADKASSAPSGPGALDTHFFLQACHCAGATLDEEGGRFTRFGSNAVLARELRAGVASKLCVELVGRLQPTKTMVQNTARMLFAAVSGAPLLLEGPPGVRTC